MSTIDDFAAGFADEAGWFDFASFGPMGTGVVQEARALTELQSRSRHGSVVALDEQAGRARRAVAALTGFPTDHVVFQPSTSQGMMHTLFGLTGALALSPREYPTTPLAATRASSALRVLDTVWLDVPDEAVTPAVLREHLTPSVTAVAVSVVDYRTGYLADLEGIRQVIGDRLLIVDGIQGFGVVDAPWGVADVLVTGGQKWLRAGWGTGFMALSDRALTDLTPVFSGVHGSEITLGGSYEHGAEPAPGAAAFQLSRPDPIAEARLATSLEEIAAVGIRPVAGAVAERATRLIDLADEFAVPVTSSRVESERAGIVVLEPEPQHLTALTASLLNHGVSATVRSTSVRLSTHVSNGEDSFGLLREALMSYGSSISY
ncbi:aminotransferase class V-fold PLP-dependent enzyme [Frigoribacterium sp. PvP032]|uniref:aminotransferase class V-fold PLP-dependent enzyme n=1 Tax=Frigoribacterium sp. PvP032 TaxID=2806589 RepID=UPI001AE86E7D|nr:aminotransferase class V-fold PLP-dependent enzyme [Frigoribacterium sp. PvP032]MBP1191482.1 selenocysteine lyase/cysteine desulfurase [Frigoribacterium sp. PvP032]